MEMTPMTSFQITISPSRRAATRFISTVRRLIQKSLVEEQRVSGLTQSDMARSIDVHRSVINREIRGKKDITVGRVGELAWALGREIRIDFVKPTKARGENTRVVEPGGLPKPISKGLIDAIADEPGQRSEDDSPLPAKDTKSMIDATPKRERSSPIEERQRA